jgi:glycosyltransferase involved in cell wall biosynthesis
VRSTILYPPAPQRPYRCDEYGDYIFMVSRLTPLKRADLLLEALATPDGAGIRAVIAGDGEDRDRLGRFVDQHDLSERVTFTGPISQPQLLHYLAYCVVTCADSGGPAELVADGVSGYVCEPNAPALAARLRQLMDDPPLAERLGQQAFLRGAALTWPDAVKQLTSL